LASATIASGMEDLVIAGGTEMMSNYGYGGNEAGPFLDSGNTHLRARYPQPHQGVCGDAIATLEGITREDVDRLAVESQTRAARAVSEGAFERSLVPVYHDNGELALAKDEYPRAGTTMEVLA